MIKYYKTVKSKACKPSAETTKKVLKFYNHNDIPSLPPCKNLARKLKDHLGVYNRIPMLVMEVSLINAFKSFKKDNASIKISQRTFEQLRPKSSTTPCPAAAVLLHLSHFDYIRKACNNLFVKNGKNIPFPNNETLVSSALCSPNSIKCIMSICQTYTCLLPEEIRLLHCVQETVTLYPILPFERLVMRFEKIIKCLSLMMKNTMCSLLRNVMKS